jgi:hypothetical protein
LSLLMPPVSMLAGHDWSSSIDRDLDCRLQCPAAAFASAL